MLRAMKAWLERNRRAHELGAIAAVALGCSRREGLRVMQSMLRANQDFIRLSHGLGSLHPAQLPRVHWPESDTFRSAVRQDGRPLLLATLHMGNYLQHLLALAPQLAWLERVTLLRRLPDPNIEVPLVARARNIGLELQVLHTGRQAGRNALRALDRGEHVLLLYDVPPSFDIGRTVAARLLGRPAALPAGPALLCRASGALLWPFCVVPERQGLRLHARDPFAVLSATDVENAVLKLARFAESVILAAPGQWLLWAHLPEMWSAAAAIRT